MAWLAKSQLGEGTPVWRHQLISWNSRRNRVSFGLMSTQKLGGCQNDKPWGLVIRKSAHLLMTPDILSFTHYTSGAHWGTRSNSLWSETSRCLSRLTGILRLLGSKTNQQVHITSDEVLLSTQGLPIPLLHFFHVLCWLLCSLPGLCSLCCCFSPIETNALKSAP